MTKRLFGNSYLIYKNNNYFIDKVNTSELIDKIDLPAFIFLKNRIIENIKRIVDVLDKTFNNFKLYYSVKSNFIPDILKIIISQNVGLSLISNFEFSILKKIIEMNHSISLPNLMIGGPKFDEYLINNSVPFIDSKYIIYNLNHLRKIGELSQKKDLEFEILIRINEQKKNPFLGFIMDKNEIYALSEVLSKYEHIKIVGLLAHPGTLKGDVKKPLDIYTNLIEKLNVLEDKSLIETKILNFGGGLPISSQIKNDALINFMNNIKELTYGAGYQDIIHSFEPGRFIVGDTAILLTKILSLMNSSYIQIDAGNHILPNFAKNPLRFYNLHHPPIHYNNPVNIYGIIPSNDLIVRKYNFCANNKVGDDLLIQNCGSYSHTFSTRFPYKFPSNYLIEDDKIIKIDFLNQI